MHSRAPLCQSAYGNRDSSLGRLALENTTAPVTHVGLQGLTGLHLTPCVRAEQWLTDWLWLCVHRFRLIHTPSWGWPRLKPPTLHYPCSRQWQLWGLHCQYRAHCSDATLPVLMNRLDFLEDWHLIWQWQLGELKLWWVSQRVSLPFRGQLLFSEWNHTALRSPELRSTCCIPVRSPWPRHRISAAPGTIYTVAPCVSYSNW